MILFILLLLIQPAMARDFGQWDISDPIVQWYSRLRQPDNPAVSCCGLGDAYWADETEFRNGQMIAVITDTRDDGPLMRPHEKPGTRYVVPTNKITYKDGNPTGHVVIFLSAISWLGSERQPRQVLCYVMNGGV